MVAEAAVEAVVEDLVTVVDEAVVEVSVIVVVGEVAGCQAVHDNLAEPKNSREPRCHSIKVGCPNSSSLKSGRVDESRGTMRDRGNRKVGIDQRDNDVHIRFAKLGT